MNPAKWLYLSNLIEMLQDEQKPDEDPKITLAEISDMMNEAESEKLSRMEEASATWWDLFVLFLGDVEATTRTPREDVKRAAMFADLALAEYDDRWATKLRGAQ